MFHCDPLLQDFVSPQPATALFVLNELSFQITGVDLEVRLCLLVTSHRSPLERTVREAFRTSSKEMSGKTA